MKYCTLLLMALSFLSSASRVDAQVPKLDAPATWRTESVRLPPPFAPKVKLKGKANVYFSPGWGKKDSDQFFTYTFMFQTEAEPKFDKKVIEEELLAYFGGLASAVSRGKVDASKFEMEVQEAKDETKNETEAQNESANNKNFNAKLKWTEPFFTKAEQTLHLEIAASFDAPEKKNYLIVSVSPQDPESETKESMKVWQQLRTIRGAASNAKEPAETPAKKSE